MGRRPGWRPPPWHAPPGMVAQCDELRRIGHWREAARMAGFDVDIDMIHVEDTHGPDAVAEVEALLRALAPDLLRQYLPPRQDGPTLTFLLRGEDRELLLAAYQPGVGGRYSLGLGLAAQMTDHSDVLPVWCWRADAVEERRRAYAEPAPHTGDVDLVTPDELHPLVHRALYPDRIQHHAWRELRWPTIRVRCANAEWHELRFVGGRLTALAHPVWPDLPDTGTGCSAALRAWRVWAGRLPRRLAEIRDDVFLRARLGCTEEVVAALDAGFDPAAFDRQGQTLMHHLGYLDPVPIWPRLLAAHVPVDGLDARGRTPMDVAVALRAYEAIRLLRAADPNQNGDDRRE